IELGNGEVHALVLVGDAVVRRIARRIKDLLPSLLPLVRNMTRETLLKVEQSLLVLLNSHGCSNSGRVARNPFRIILFDGIGRGNPEQLSRHRQTPSAWAWCGARATFRQDSAQRRHSFSHSVTTLSSGHPSQLSAHASHTSAQISQARRCASESRSMKP